MLAYGSYADSPRTVTGILIQLAQVGFTSPEIRALLRSEGLPANMMDDPEFTISADLELNLLSHVIRRLSTQNRDITGYAIEEFSAASLNHYGILGLTLQHAPSLLVATRELLANPHLTWGHSRIVLARGDKNLRVTFDMASFPKHIERDQMAALASYCVLRDLTAFVRLLYDVSGGRVRPLSVRFPFPPPGGKMQAEDHLGCPVSFNDADASAEYTIEQMEAPAEHANEFSFARYQSLSQKLAAIIIPPDSLVAEVTRCLWAYSPPPRRVEVARILGMSDRTLARHLENEETSYRKLTAEVSAERARNYLAHSVMPVAQIAELMGYSDPPGFNRAFRAWTGQAPTEWRSANEAEGRNR